MNRPRPLERLSDEKNGSNRWRSTVASSGGPSLQMDSRTCSSPLGWVITRMDAGCALAWRSALSSRFTSSRRRCSGSKATCALDAWVCTPRRWPGCTCALHSPVTTRTEASSGTTGAAPADCEGCTRATLRMSSTMRESRVAFCSIMPVSRFCAGSFTSSSSSALAWVMAVSGLRISWATAADMRPMEASFSVRTRASTSRRSSRNSTHRPARRPSEAVSRVRASSRWLGRSSCSMVVSVSSGWPAAKVSLTSAARCSQPLRADSSRRAPSG